MCDFANKDRDFMARALLLAEKAASCGEVPIGALVVYEGAVIGEGYNNPIGRHDPSAHAEVVALRAASKRLQNYRLPGATLYVTLEPCMMCLGVILHARLTRLVYSLASEKTGAFSLACGGDTPGLGKLVVSQGILAAESQALLQAFFLMRRGN